MNLAHAKIELFPRAAGQGEPIVTTRRVSGMVIETGVPMPCFHGQKKGVMQAMAIGDSIVMSRHDANYFTSLAKKFGMTFRTRKISETESRCWRVE